MFGGAAHAELSCENYFEVDTMRIQFRAESARLRIAGATAEAIELSPGRNVFVQVVKPESADMPFYLFLPGSNRSLFLNESHADRFIANGFGMGSMNFSTQPHSISSLKRGVRPAFLNREMKLADFAQEVESTIASLKAR